jgi:thioredoxin reductase
MDFWSRRMPKGMCLRSPARASSLSDPDGLLTLEAFAAERNVSLGPPVPLDSFVEYGHWFADRAGVDVDPRLVQNLSVDGGVFVATLEDGESIRARRVVLAAGSEPFQWTPPEFRGLPQDLVSHAADHGDLGVFAGKELVVLGAGQAGIEYAAIASEQGANVRVIVRAPLVRWLTRSAKLHRAPLLSTLLYAPSDVGPAALSRIVSLPELFRSMPTAARDKATKRCTRPAAAAWLIERTRNIPIDTGRPISSVAGANGGIRIDFEGGDALDADHLLLATGYRVDLSLYGFLAPELLAAVKTRNGFPVLGRGLTSSVPGLHMVGWPATRTYGPLMRHVVGSEFAATAVTARLSRGKIEAPEPHLASVAA